MFFFYIELQEEYPVNDPEVNHAATKIQAKFRGHKARQDVEKLKQEVCCKKKHLIFCLINIQIFFQSKQTFDTDQQELGYGREPSTTSDQNESRMSHVEEPVISNKMIVFFLLKILFRNSHL